MELNDVNIKDPVPNAGKNLLRMLQSPKVLNPPKGPIKLPPGLNVAEKRSKVPPGLKKISSEQESVQNYTLQLKDAISSPVKTVGSLEILKQDEEVFNGQSTAKIGHTPIKQNTGLEKKGRDSTPSKLKNAGEKKGRDSTPSKQKNNAGEKNGRDSTPIKLKNAGEKKGRDSTPSKRDERAIPNKREWSKPDMNKGTEKKDWNCSVATSGNRFRPNMELMVNLNWSRELSVYLKDGTRPLEVAMFRANHHFHDNPITGKRVDVGKGTRLKTSAKFGFRAPRSPGEYEFRLIRTSGEKEEDGKRNEVEYFASSNRFLVDIQGDDILEALLFIQKRMRERESAASAYLQFSRLITQIKNYAWSPAPEHRQNALKARDSLGMLVVQCCENVVPSKPQPSSATKEYSRDLHAALNAVLVAVIQNSVVWSNLSEGLKQMVATFQLKFYCHLAELYFTPLLNSTQDVSSSPKAQFWMSHYLIKLWTANPSQLTSKLDAVTWHALTFQLERYAKALLPKEETFLQPRVRARNQLVQLVQDITTQSTIYKDKVRLDLQVFGSSQNNFGTANSDMDMCLVVHELSQSNDQLFGVVEFLNCIMETLQSTNKYGKFQILEARLSARIPILMLREESTNLDIDICINNPLAIRNTALLRAYSFCDQRLRPLAYIIKRWTKQRRMNNPPEGTLSSYGYLLMLIAYLQQLQPPVLPVLQSIHPSWNGNPQEIYNASQLPSVKCPGIGDGTSDKLFETYFYDPINNNRMVGYLQAYGAANRQNIFELLMGFWHFYALELDCSQSIVSVRVPKLLDVPRKLETMPTWRQSRRFSIEDPFETSYDVAHVLKDSRYRYIRQEFARAYALAVDECLKCELPGHAEVVVSKLLDAVNEKAETVPFIKVSAAPATKKE